MIANNPIERVLDFSKVLKLCQISQASGKRIVLTNGCFDILHRGHLEYLRSSADLGDLLVVALNSDESVRALKGTSRPINGEQDRAYALTCLRFVDAVFIFPGSRIDEEIKTLKPEIYTKAGDYRPETLDRLEYESLIKVGAEIRIMPFIKGHSTTSIIDKLSTKTK